jgi:hypothetical protein
MVSGIRWIPGHLVSLEGMRGGTCRQSRAHVLIGSKRLRLMFSKPICLVSMLSYLVAVICLKIVCIEEHVDCTVEVFLAMERIVLLA